MKKSVNVYYALFQCAYWMGYASMGGFASAYLLGEGLSNGIIGMILAVAGAVSALISPYVGQLIDRNKKVSNKLVLIFLSGMVVIFSLILFFWKGKPLYMEGILFGLGSFFLLTSQPFTNALAMSTIMSGYKLNFGPTRALGSMGYAIAAVIAGQLTTGFGTGLIPMISAILFFLTVLMLVIYPVKEQTAAIPDGAAQTSAIDFLKKYKLFSVMLIGMTLLYFSHVLINTFAYQIIQTKGGDSDSMGISSAIAAVSETVTMVLFSIYRSKLKLHNIIKLSGIFFTLKILCSLLVPGVGWYFAVQIFQMYGWGFLATGIVFYVNELVDECDQAQGQAFAGMTLTFGNVFGALLGGLLLEWAGVNMMLIFGTVIAGIGALILWIFTKPTEGPGKRIQVSSYGQ